MLKSLCIFILLLLLIHILSNISIQLTPSLEREIQCFLDFVSMVARLVDADVTDATQEGEVDDAVLVFLVVVHQLYQFIVVITGDRQCAVVFLDETYGLSHIFGRETCMCGTEIW